MNSASSSAYPGLALKLLIAAEASFLCTYNPTAYTCEIGKTRQKQMCDLASDGDVLLYVESRYRGQMIEAKACETGLPSAPYLLSTLAKMGGGSCCAFPEAETDHGFGSMQQQYSSLKRHLHQSTVRHYSCTTILNQEGISKSSPAQRGREALNLLS